MPDKDRTNHAHKYHEAVITQAENVEIVSVSKTPGMHGALPWASLWPLLLLFAFAKLLLQSAITAASTHAGYGIFSDEFYYLVCGHRPALGYVDQPPLVALQARLAEAFFGYHNLVLFRLLPALAGALMVALTGTLAAALGGTRKAAALAMLAILPVPVYLATQSFLSMNAWEPVFWSAALLALIRVLREPAATGWWLLLGASGGLGLENKASIVFFLLSLLLALLLTPARSLLRTRGFALACALTLALAAPHLWWQLRHGWPTLEWLTDVAHSDKVAVLPPPQFLLEQVLMLSPLHLLVWLPGMLWLLTARAARLWRPLGWLYVVFLALMLTLHAKDYYLAPIYPVYFAAGAVFWARWAFAARARTAVVATAAVLLTLSSIFAAPFAVPVLAPAQFVRFTHALHFTPIESEQHPGASFPEFFADHLDWERLVAGVSKVYRSLSPAEQHVTGIFTSNYEQASAINILGGPLGLPAAISGHQNYWLWGPAGYTGEEMIVVTDAAPAEMTRFYRTCTVRDQQTSPYQMPWEQRYIYLCRGRYQNYADSWNALKLYR